VAAALLLGAALASRPAGAAEGSVRLTVPPGEYTVGDPIVLTISVSHPPGAEFEPFDLTPWTAPPGGKPEGSGETVAPLAVEPAQIQKKDPPEPRQTVWTIRVRPFLTGEIPLAPLTLRYRLPGSSERHEMTTEASFLRVASVLKTPDEPAADIRGPWRLPRSWWGLLLGLAAALAALAAAWYLWKRRRARPAPAAPAEPEPIPAPEISPYERAMRDLLALLESRLLAEKRLKEFHVRLSEIVKTFLGGHLGFDVVDRTTGEVLADLARAGSEEQMRASVRGFLEACDLVKFAKHHPAPVEIEETVTLARALIDLGRPLPGGEDREEAA
jgi:hypothetical protein